MMKWKNVQWQDVLTIKNGKDQKKVVNPNGQYPIYGSGGVMGYADDFLCPEGTTVIGRKGSINNPIYVTEKFWNVDTAFGLCPREDLNGKFLYYYCTTYNFLRHNKATTLPSLTKVDLLKIEIPLPPLNEQKRIAAILDAADALRQKDKALIAKYDELTQALFLDMFGDPVSNPKGWEKVKLKEVGSVKIGPFGSLLHKEDYVADGIPLVNPSHIISGKIVIDTKLTVSHDKIKELKSYCMKVGDVIVGRRGEIGRCAVVSKKENGYLCGTGSVFIRPADKLNSLFLQNIISANSIRKVLENSAKGITMKNLNSTILEELVIPLPNLSLQKKFVLGISLIEQQKLIAQRSLEKSEQLFNSLLQKAFKGELSLKDQKELIPA